MKFSIMFPDTQKLKKRATATITPIHPEHRNSVSSVLTSVAEVADDRTNAGTLGASSLTLRQSVLPVSLVITLFCVWGFASGMLEILNKHFQHTLHVSKAQSAGLQVAFFGCVELLLMFLSNHRLTLLVPILSAR